MTLVEAIRPEAIRLLPLSHRFTGHILRDISISLITTLTATAIWSALPARQEKIALRAEPTPISTPASSADLAAAAQFEQIALSKLAPLKPEAELLRAPVPQLNVAQAPLLAKPVHKSAKPQVLTLVALPVPATRPSDLVLSASTNTTLADVSLSPPAIVPPLAIAPPQPKPSLIERIASQVPGHDQLAAGIGATTDFVSGIMPKFN